jgi:isoleucyl-tRNA synthetase
MSVPEQRAAWARTHAEMIAREILATTFEFGEPTDASDIGDGVRVTIGKA